MARETGSAASAPPGPTSYGCVERIFSRMMSSGTTSPALQQPPSHSKGISIQSGVQHAAAEAPAEQAGSLEGVFAKAAPRGCQWLLQLTRCGRSAPSRLRRPPASPGSSTGSRRRPQRWERAPGCTRTRQVAWGQRWNLRSGPWSPGPTGGGCGGQAAPAGLLT